MYSGNFIDRSIKQMYHKFLFYVNKNPYSAYQLKQKCIFIHIPKTAGTSILHQINNGQRIPRNHATWKEYQKRSPHFFRYYFKFAFVRNPWDRAVSIYSYISQKEEAKTTLGEVPLRDIFLNEIDSFEEYVMKFLNKDIIYTHALLMPQWLFIMDEMDIMQVDFLGKYEKLDVDYELIKNMIGLKAPKLEKINTSYRKNYRDYYSEASKQKIAELYSKDIKLFGYSY